MKPTETNELNWVGVLCVFAVVHVLFFCAAYPLFNPVDEVVHLDLALKYAQGGPPRTQADLDKEAMNYIAIYSTQEYTHFPPKEMNDYPPPVWTASDDINGRLIAARQRLWNTPNYESAQPPLYYTMAGIWWRAGKQFGFHGGYLVYWLRILNALVAAGLVWLGYQTARTVFPEDRFIRFGVAALLVCFPQNAFYSVQNDMMSAITFGAAFILSVKLLGTETPGTGLGISTGLALAAAFLTKTSNLPLLAVAIIFLVFRFRKLAYAGRWRAAGPAYLSLALCAGIPAAGWMAWCKYHFGDFLGTAAKIGFLGWTYKPFTEWFNHPIFTPYGFWTFYSELLASFWQGEVLWHQKPLAPMATGLIYVFLSTFLIGVAISCLRRPDGAATESSRLPLRLAGCGILAAIIFLGFLSIIYDFHSCNYPSRGHPYFVSGRLILGILIPFLLALVYGLDRLLAGLNLQRLRSTALAGLILFMLVSEFTYDRPLLASQYNWFHLGNVPVQTGAVMANGGSPAPKLNGSTYDFLMEKP